MVTPSAPDRPDPQDRAQAMLVAHQAGASLATIAAQWGMSREGVRKTLLRTGGPTASARTSSPLRFTDEMILAGLQELSRVRAAELGVPGPVRVTIAQWDAWRDPAALPSAVRVLQRLGTWATVCAQAGLPVSERTAPSGSPPRWSDEELVVWVALFLLDAAGGSTATAEYARWARRMDGAPGLQTVLFRLGGWNAAKAAVSRGTAHT